MFAVAEQGAAMYRPAAGHAVEHTKQAAVPLAAVPLVRKHQALPPPLHLHSQPVQDRST